MAMETRARINKAQQIAARYGIILSERRQDGTYLVSRNEDTGRVIVYGLWAVEQFLRGVEFANGHGSIPTGPGKWKND